MTTAQRSTERAPSPPTGPGERKRPAPAGAAVLREDVTAAIRDAVFQELAEVGYARMSIEGVARRAGVGKTAVYRRWSSKLALVLDLIAVVGDGGGFPAPATGRLVGDLRAVLGIAARALRHPIASQVIPDLLVESARHPEIADTVRLVLLDPQHGVASTIVRDAVERGELSADTDPSYLLDVTLGPLYWRLAIARNPLPAGYLDELADAAAAALQNSTRGRTGTKPPRGGARRPGSADR